MRYEDRSGPGSEQFMHLFDDLDPFDPLRGPGELEDGLETVDPVVAPLPVAPNGIFPPTLPAAGDETDPVAADGLNLADLRAFMEAGALDRSAAGREAFGGSSSEGPIIGRMLAERFGAEMTPKLDGEDAFNFDGLTGGPGAVGADAGLDPFMDVINPAWGGDIAPFLDPATGPDVGRGVGTPPLDPDGAPPGGALDLAPVVYDTPDGWVV